MTSFSDGTRDAANPLPWSELPNLSIDNPFQWRLDPDPERELDCADLSSTVAMPGGPAGDTANVAGGVLTWCDAGEWCATSTVGPCGVLFFSLPLATGEAPEAEGTGTTGAATHGEEGFRSRELALGGGLAVPSAGGDGSGAHSSPGHST